MSGESKARILSYYISSLKDFTFVDPEPLHKHMGAIIADAILQSGLNFETVVKPRVQKLLINYPEAATTSGFLKLIEKLRPETILDWRHPEKPFRVLEVTRLFASEDVENEHELKNWLEQRQNVAKLDSIKGVGRKTIDYFRLLSGTSTVAVDRHMLNFLKKAGIKVKGYDEAKAVINCAADLMGKDRSELDQSIWSYMSKKKLENE
jgi:endonuclease III-like uncharacterized protein